jgi:hypothetical protein
VLAIINQNNKKYMPRLNGTGPRGQGSQTGRGMGNCQRNVKQDYEFSSKKNGIAYLENKEKALEEELDIIRQEKSVLKNQEK